eukprot:CAMPEP_0172539048 /NCGR_PEP_ID=MMETSP1067-20121228/10322_1 /TAXON_ID=265564 ORGANISM="Thalassiosira punctigera, Strain Tpunct2005C2" /NCGR_SAMPLE_ID=MMETSP1067 /ASSEMBLY_ACC=CAM_ASM_000444 /LENGTH=334 /DNA_ID=CAMNT_0013324671 /DNA_START=1190 /DNA_END=2194 /DNA_ORIENTATION=+
MEIDSKLTVGRLHGPLDLLALVASFADLSEGTEFQSYKEPQWRFLLSGEEMTGYVIYSRGEERSNDTADPHLDGCVLKVNLDDDTIGFGMVLVRPSKRGKGLARVLLKEAMQAGKEQGKRFVLAVCSTLGQPLYRKLGFLDAGVVTALTCSASDLIKMPHEHFGNEHVTVVDGKSCTDEQFSMLVDRDERARGIRREDRMRMLLRGYADGSRSTVVLSSTAARNLDLGSLSIGVARQDCVDGPVFIGPISGREELFIPLMHALIEKHFGDSEKKDMEDVSVMMMVTDHLSVVTKLLEVQGMRKLWECPAMSSDGRPIYQHEDGTYLAMMHPTLG